jgi:hypothetical protein
MNKEVFSVMHRKRKWFRLGPLNFLPVRFFDYKDAVAHLSKEEGINPAEWVVNNNYLSFKSRKGTWTIISDEYLWDMTLEA